MRKKVGIAVFASAFAVCVLIWLTRVPEPSFNGIPLGTLLDSNPAAGGGLIKAQEAVRELGAKAVPYLVTVLEQEPTPLQQWYNKAHPRFPVMLQKFAPQIKNFNQRRSRAAAVLTQAGANAITSIPLLARTAQSDPFFGTRHNAVGTLARIAPGTEHETQAALAVISRTTDANKALCEHAYGRLGAFTNEMQRVVPVLLHGLRNPAFQENALQALKRLGTNVMPLVRDRVQNEGYLPMSFDALALELSPGTKR